MQTCPNCEGSSFADAVCTRCHRPQIPDTQYFDAIETLAWNVLNRAYEEYGDGFSLANPGRSPLETAIIQLGGRLRHYHYEGDGCVD